MDVMALHRKQRLENAIFRANYLRDPASIALTARSPMAPSLAFDLALLVSSCRSWLGQASTELAEIQF